LFSQVVHISGRDLTRDGLWGPPGGHSYNWHNQRR
jgi:hypothetical protein